MSVESPVSMPGPGHDWVADDEIDLRKYAGIVFRWWREIVLATVLAALAGGLAVVALRAASTPTYEASSNVAIVRTFSDVSFDPRFRTLSEETAEGAVALGASRRGALLGLVNSGAVAQAVIDELGDQLAPLEQSPSRLMGLVEAELVTQAGSRAGDSDLIRITVTADSRQKAVAIANAWAHTYVEQVNAIYSQVPDEVVASISTELEQAQASYGQAQLALESFISTSRAGDLSRMVADKQSVVASLLRGKDAALTASIDDMVARRKKVASSYLNAQVDNELLAFEREQQAQRALLDAYLDAVNRSQVASFRTQVDDSLQRLGSYYERRTRLYNVLANARTLQEQVDSIGSGDVSGSVLAYQLMLLDTVTSIPNQQFVLMNPLAPVSSQGTAGTSYLPLSRVGETAPAGQGADATPAQQSTVTALPLPAAPAQQAPAQQVPAQQAPSVQVQVSDSPYQLQLNALTEVTKEQLTDNLAAFIGALESRISQLDQDVATLTEELLGGNNYDYLNARIPEDSELMAAIDEQYPALFETSQLAERGMQQAAGSTLSEMGLAVTDELLNLEDLPNITTEGGDDALNQALSRFQNEIQLLQAELEAEQAHERQLAQARDLAWDTLTALKNKVVELSLARAASSSEVRFAAAAVEPSEPVPGLSLTVVVALAGMMGLLLAVFAVFIADHLGKRPFLARST